MSIASELSALNGYILGAYDEINDKGGTVPANKNMANLAGAIASISGGGGTPLASCGIITASQDGGVNVEHGLGQRPTIWGIRRTGNGVSGAYSRYEAIQKIRYYESHSADNAVYSVDIKSNRDMSSWNKNYTELVISSAINMYPDTDTPFTYGFFNLPVNNKYIGMQFNTTHTLDAYLKTGVEYFWFALVTSTTP